MDWMIYGANGYTGRMMVEEAVKRGLRPVLAGRSAASLEPLAQKHGLPVRAFALDNAQALSRRIAAALGELADRISVSSDGDRHRVRAGPFGSRDAAQGAARALRDQLGLEALLITR